MDRFFDFGLDGNDDEVGMLIICACAYVVMMWMTGRLDINQPIPRHIRNQERGLYLRRVIESSDTTCRNMFRMDREVFFNLCSLLKSRNLLHDTCNVTVEEQVGLFLHTVGHNVRNRVLGTNFIRSGETISRYFQNVLHAIGELRRDYICGPSTIVHEKITEDERFSDYFKDCIGAIDGTHIHASVPLEEVGPFYGRKPYPTQNVLAAVDFDLRFTYVLAGWEGSAHDITVLRDALERPHGLRVPEGRFYLCDAGYNTRPGFLAPYRAVRYHLSDFSGRLPSNYKELYNYRHSSLRTTVERAFGSLKGRFKILASRPFFPYRTQVDIVMAACILHNFILSHGLDDFVPTENEWETQNVSEGGRTSREIREQNNIWVQKREEIARKMWEDLPH